MARLYTNENFYLPVVVLLRNLGHDVLTSLEAGRANLKIPDPDVLAFAIAEKRCVLTLNRMHFGKLHAITPSHFGIITCTEDSNFEALAMRIHEAVLSTNNLDNQLIKIYRPNVGK
jgi:hypothetical protein